jgi:hypothetical protein
MSTVPAINVIPQHPPSLTYSKALVRPSASASLVLRYQPHRLLDLVC